MDAPFWHIPFMYIADHSLLALGKTFSCSSVHVSLVSTAIWLEYMLPGSTRAAGIGFYFS